MTKIYYLGLEGSYHHETALKIQENFNVDIDDMIWKESFEQCWEQLWKGSVLLLAIENSSAGSIYENLYKFLKVDAQIIWEYNLKIHHCLCSHEQKKEDITTVYSHSKALPQCYEYLKRMGIKKQIVYPDNAWAAQSVAKKKEKWAAAICSRLAWEMYGLQILDENIQDQEKNTTRFIIVVGKDSHIKYKKKEWKVSIIFDLKKNIPASLYKCLWAFATNNVNLTKIESLPDIKNPFSYIFWLDFEGELEEKRVKNSLKELELFTNDIKILGEY